MSFVSNPGYGIASSGNTTTSTLGSSATFTGTGEENPFPDVMCSCYSDTSGTLYFDFSVNGTDWRTFPVQGFSVSAGIHEFHTAVKGPRYFRVRFVNSASVQSAFQLYTYYGAFSKMPNSPLNQSQGLDADAILTRGTIAQDEINRGLRSGVQTWNKFGYRSATTAAAGDETMWFDNSNLTIMTSSDTFDITYNNATDGAGGGATGATVLLIDYIDANFELQQTTHVIGSTGTDTTSFSGLGINRAVVVSSGTNDANVNDITISDTAGTAGTQGIIPANDSVTQQLVFHMPINYKGIIKNIRLNAEKLSGGGNIRAVFKMFVYNRLVDTQFKLRRYIIDTQSTTTITETDPVGINVDGRDVIFFTVDTDTNNTEVAGNFSLNIYQTV